MAWLFGKNSIVRCIYYYGHCQIEKDLLCKTIEINNNPHIVGIHTEKNADFKEYDEIIINKNYKDDLVKLAEKIKNNYKNEKFYTDPDDFATYFKA